MTIIRDRFWDIAYAVLLVAAVPAAIFHAVQARWPQAILVTAAAAVGAVLLITGWQREPSRIQRRQATERAPEAREPDSPLRVHYQRAREDSGRFVGWLPLGLLSGFVATGIMTGAFLLGYAISALFASDAEGANQLQIWFSSLIENTITDVAVGNLAVAIGLHVVAGLAWAVVYTAFVEPRLSGTGLQRGVKFSLVPWLLSIIVFFPLAGAGFLGFGLDAGPLPILGNLILHIVYGAALGKTYESNAVWDEPGREVASQNIQILEVAQATMAIGIVPGLVAGLIIGLLLSTVVAPDLDTLMAGVLGALVGSAAGVWIGSLSGLSPGEVDGNDEPSPQRE